MRKLRILGALFLSLILIMNSCKEDDPAPTKGTLKGTVTDILYLQAIPNVKIAVYDATTNSPTGMTAETGSDGKYSISLSPGTYYLKLEKQGYQGIPAPNSAPISVIIEAGVQAEHNYQMKESTVTDGGLISGKVTENGNAAPGVFIIANDGTTGYSSISTSDGSFIIYNIPAGTYKLKGYISNYNSTEITVNVTANSESKSQNLALTKGATGSVSGAVSFLATNNGDVDVTLTHPITKEPIPGLIAETQASLYTIPQIPDGKYIARASYKNDGYVVDPDWIIKNGEPQITINGNSLSLNFSVTGAVALVSPTNDSTTTLPIETTETAPTFEWKAYSSVSDYIIEVSDINGNVIWGGFTKSDNTITKNISIPKTQLKITYNSDGKASGNLKKGSVYRWRIFASKDDSKEPNGWKLISVSEEQRGIFIIK